MNKYVITERERNGKQKKGKLRTNYKKINGKWK
jgi:hypothetical protein